MALIGCLGTAVAFNPSLILISCKTASWLLVEVEGGETEKGSHSKSN